MFEKVNPCHPDKVADRIAGAIVDLSYEKAENPKVAVEVLIGHGNCMIITETSVRLTEEEVTAAVRRITGSDRLKIAFLQNAQDEHLTENQSEKLRCGDNGIFKGVPVTGEQRKMTEIAEKIFEMCPFDGKYILNEAESKLIICQSNADSGELQRLCADQAETVLVNPLGDWTGGTDVDSGATNRKLGSDMADSVTGGGLHGKDLSKADVSVNIYAWLKAQEEGRPVEFCCAIGDESIDGRPYEEIVAIAGEFIRSIGGFEKFAEWGLVR